MVQNTRNFQKIILTFCLTLGFYFPSFAETKLQREMIDAMHSLFFVLDHMYAPKDWKEQFLGWSVEDQRDSIIQTILENPDITVKQFHGILLRSINRAHDYHLTLGLFTQEKATLPFIVKPAENRYFVVFVKDQNFPLNVGDEVVAMNDQPVEEVVKELLSMYSGNSRSLTEKMLYSRFLTIRAAQLGHIVPKGPVTLSIKKKDGQEIIEINTSWTYSPDLVDFSPISNHDTLLANSSNLDSLSYLEGPKQSDLLKLISKIMLFQNDFLAPININEVDEDREANPHSTIGAKKSFLPEMGQIISKKQSPFFHNYLFKHKNKKIAYLRINSYSSLKGTLSAENFQNLINHYEKESDLLIIDQIHNPGGSVDYLYALASMLSNKPLALPLHRVTTTPMEIAIMQDSIEILQNIKTDIEAQKLFKTDNFQGLPVNLALAKGILKQFQITIKAWQEGERLTDPLPLLLESLSPSQKGVYTKPIIILIDEFAFSGGDFFPAIMQDNGRAVIFGQTTAGAGGYTLSTTFGANRLGIQNMHYTGSIARRRNPTQPIENLGVIPDVNYAMTAYDYQNNFEGYKQALLRTVERVLGL